MELEIILKLNGGRTCYRIHQENAGIFTACLTSCEGEALQNLPEEIAMIKGVRNWTGSVDDYPLLRHLGAQIDANWHQDETNQLRGVNKR